MNTLHGLISLLQIQTLLNAEKYKFIVRCIQHLRIKYFDLNAISMNAEIHRHRHRIVLYKNVVHPDASISTWTTLD